MKTKGSRSSFDARSWKCSCGFINKPTKHTFFNLPAFQCGKCKAEFALDFSFCLGHIKVNGKDIVGDILDQGRKRYCVAYAYCKAAEITERVACIKNGIDPDTAFKFNANQLESNLLQKFPELSMDAKSPSSDMGLLRIVHMGLILRSESNDCYVATDVSTIPRDDFEDICKSIAEGDPLIGTYRVGKRIGQLPYCKIYKSPHEDSYDQKNAPRRGHAVVLVGGGIKKGKRFFYFINSWGNRFCPRRNNKGDLITAGIGKLRSNDLTKNVIRLHASEGTGGERRLQDQLKLNISRLNYVLMTARKNQSRPQSLQNLRAEDPFGDIEADICSDEYYENDLQTNFLVDQKDTTRQTLNIETDWSGGSSNPCSATTCSHGGCCPPRMTLANIPLQMLSLAWARCSLMNDVVPCPTADNAALTPDARSDVPRHMKDIPNSSMSEAASSPTGSATRFPTANSATPAPNAPTAVPRFIKWFQKGSTNDKAPGPVGSTVPCLTADNSAPAPHGSSAVPRRMSSVAHGSTRDTAFSLSGSTTTFPMANRAAIAPDAGSAVPVPPLLSTLPLLYHDI